jgi:hypothetical protein
MCPVIDSPASCEIRIVILFLHAKNMSASEIHHELHMFYGQNVMSEGTIRQHVECSKMGKKMFTMASRVVCHWY